MLIFDDLTDVFPSAFIQVIATRISDLFPELSVVQRRLKLQDRTRTVGVFPMPWTPDIESLEFGQGNLVLGQPNSTLSQPTIGTYGIGLQALIQNSDQVQASAESSAMSYALRYMLYNDAALGVGLDSLSVTYGTSPAITERAQRRGITRVRYLDNEVSGTYVALNTIEYYIDTQTK